MTTQGRDNTDSTSTNSSDDVFEHELTAETSEPSNEFCTLADRAAHSPQSHELPVNDDELNQSIIESCINEARSDNVVSLFAPPQNDIQPESQIVQVYPESSGIKMLYSSKESPDRCVAVPIICWALRANGKIDGLVPWIGEVLDCETIASRFDLSWQGYFDEANEDIFDMPPGYAVAMLTTAARFMRDRRTAQASNQVVCEFADQLGTHAMLLDDVSESLTLTSVVSWCLDSSGRLHGMLADDSRVEKYPVVAGDACLYQAEENQHFRCFFQRDIAEQIRDRDPDTLRAIEQLFITED